ncbi:MAG: hypothetical protein ABW151_11430 [Pseudorhodoplanes sp.]
MAKELAAGFTGSPADKPEGIRKAAANSVSTVKREAQAVAIGAADHPHTATTVILAIGALAFGAGYLFGRSSSGGSGGYWR